MLTLNQSNLDYILKFKTKHPKSLLNSAMDEEGLA